MLFVLALCLITTTNAINVDYYALFNGFNNKSSLEFNSNVTINNNLNVYDVMKLAVNERGNEFQFTAKYYQQNGYFVSCIASVCNNGEFYWSFWMNGKYSCSGLSDTILSSNCAVDMIYSNPNVTCPSSLSTEKTTNLDIDNKNKNFAATINVSYSIVFGENLRRSAIIGSANYTMMGIEVMERAVETQGDEFSFTTIYYQTLGDFIDCIDGICSNDDTKEYWFLYLNNNQTMTGITYLTVGNGDKLTFVYEKYQQYKHGKMDPKHFRKV